MSQNASALTIYVALIDEGVAVWRPVEAEELASGRFRILSEKLDPNEVWEFPAGTIVRCRTRQLDGGSVLVAVAREDDAA